MIFVVSIFFITIIVANKCGPNEYWDMNGEPCIRTTENPRPKCLFDKTVPGCVCNTGFKRDPNTKKCLPITTGLFQYHFFVGNYVMNFDLFFNNLNTKQQQQNQSNVAIMKPIYNVVQIVQ